MRSDGAPPLSQAIQPTWTGQHDWTVASGSAAVALLVGNGGSTQNNNRIYFQEYYSAGVPSIVFNTSGSDYMGIGTVANAIVFGPLSSTTGAFSSIAGTLGIPTSWTPTDKSGAGLTFASGTNCMYQLLGNFVYAYGQIVYPATASSGNAAISLPIAVPNASYAEASCVLTVNNAPIYNLVTVVNASTAEIFAASTAVLNSQLSSKTINFMLIYPVS